MGALLSLPLLAIPSMGTVSCFDHCHRGHSLTDNPLADDIRCVMLRSCYMLCSMQCLREISKQVRAFDNARVGVY